ncbi:EF-hand domain-containing protein [Pseudoxanthomonas sp.]|uniref:EF-hand domain-containing protein n=1 Tax=Pseudoxanthomonas sp. TaxID=1871049 RepID=UPI00261351ED|nr:EF-hand domain-containing protein [Pseudoxanthomonas sp.]WDS35553.1 MAG: EF-hand domain-containing protein [Pseudoxanthomonas sp.]
MKTMNRKPLLAMIALGAAFAAPAFAQQAQQADAATAAPATGAQTPSSAAASGGQGQQGWNDLDTDKDGAISKAESAANPGLSQIFSQADGDGDGKLTQEEYKAFVVKNYGGGAGQSQGQ